MSNGNGAGNGKLRIATAWLGGCSGCHMSFLDLDEFLVDLAGMADLVFGPLTDIKEFPPDVDITLVEGAVTNEDNRELAFALRANSRVVVSFGDCAVTGNVTALRNLLGEPEPMLQRVYVEHPDLDGQLPSEVVPALLPMAEPLHELIPIDAYMPGCPPSAERIKTTVTTLAQALVDGSPVPKATEWLFPDEARFG